MIINRIRSIGSRIFNIFSKNFMAEINGSVHKGKKRKQNTDVKQSSSARKMAKLSSDYPYSTQALGDTLPQGGGVQSTHTDI